LKQRFEYLLKC